MTAARTAVVFAMSVLLAGCAVGGGRLDIATDRTFDLRTLEAIVPGMAEADVVARLGLPGAFGVDERGRRYLHYTQVRLGSSVLAAGTGVVGVNTMSIRSTASGFEARVFLEAGRVARVATRFHAEPVQVGSDGVTSGTDRPARDDPIMWQH
jgi:hypothetical protein